MNRLKGLEDRYTQNRLLYENTSQCPQGIFDGVFCDGCGKLHGSKEPGSEAVVLTIVGNKALCYKCGIEHAKVVAKPKYTPRKRVDPLKEFGLKQEKLL